MPDVQTLYTMCPSFCRVFMPAAATNASFSHKCQTAYVVHQDQRWCLAASTMSTCHWQYAMTQTLQVYCGKSKQSSVLCGLEALPHIPIREKGKGCNGTPCTLTPNALYTGPECPVYWPRNGLYTDPKHPVHLPKCPVHRPQRPCTQVCVHQKVSFLLQVLTELAHEK